MRPVLLLIALLLPSVTAAQDRPGAARQAAPVTLVSYTLATMLMTEGPDLAAELPSALLTRLAAQPALKELDVQGQQLSVRFQFGSVEQFTAWRAAAETTALLRDLDALSPATMRVATSLRRSSGAFGGD